MEKWKQHSEPANIKQCIERNTPSVSSEDSIDELDEFEPCPTTQVKSSKNIIFRNKIPRLPSVSLRKTISEPVFKSDPVDILSKAFSETNSYGSSTAWLWTLSKKTLKVANLGDSGFIVLRYDAELQKCEIIKISTEQQHNFNTPYQLANIPFDRFKRIPVDQFWSDRPSQSDKYDLPVNQGDIVILATDGLLDNLFIYEIVEETEDFMKQNQWISASTPSMNQKFANNLVSSSKRSISNSASSSQWFKSEDASCLARKLAQKAYLKAISEDCRSPFGDKVNNYLQQKAKSYKDQDWEINKWTGGKKDDIGVVVAFIS